VRGCWLSLKTKVHDLSMVWPQNHWYGFLRFGLKTGGDGFSRLGLKTSGDSFSCFGLKIGGDGFPGLGLKTSSYSLMIWASKSLQRFLGSGLKTKRATVCQLHRKTDGSMKMV
jgi:hypothetical protein